MCADPLVHFSVLASEVPVPGRASPPKASVTPFVMSQAAAAGTLSKISESDAAATSKAGAGAAATPRGLAAGCAGAGGRSESCSDSALSSGPGRLQKRPPLLASAFLLLILASPP